MCYILVTKRPLSPDELSIVRNHSRLNRDGAGYALVEDGKIVIRKGLWSENLVEQALKVLEAPGDHWRLVHFRTATSGSIVAGLAHPFRTKQGAFAFNGHLSEDMCVVLALVLASRGVSIPKQVSDAMLMALSTSHLGWTATIPIVERGGRGVLLTPKGPRFAGYWYAEGNELFSSAPFSARFSFALDCVECNRISICDVCDGDMARLQVTIGGKPAFKRRCGNDVRCRVGGYSLMAVCEAALDYCILSGEYLDDDDDEVELIPARHAPHNRPDCIQCTDTFICTLCHKDQQAVKQLASLNIVQQSAFCPVENRPCGFFAMTMRALCSKQTSNSICLWSLLKESEEEKNEWPDVD